MVHSSGRVRADEILEFRSSGRVRADEVLKFHSSSATTAITDVNSSSYPLEAAGVSDKRLRRERGQRERRANA
jgi:hypothetical protein